MHNQVMIITKEKVYSVSHYDFSYAVQITGDLNVACTALFQIVLRLRANIFEMEGTFAAISPAHPYGVVPSNTSEGSKYSNRDNRSRSHGHSVYSGGRDLEDPLPNDSYGGSQVFITFWIDLIISD